MFVDFYPADIKNLAVMSYSACGYKINIRIFKCLISSQLGCATTTMTFKSTSEEGGHIVETSRLAGISRSSGIA
jgi:hypothetical protein